MSVKKNKTVFAESSAVVTASPYDKFRDEELELIYHEQNELSKFEKAKLRLECISVSMKVLDTTETTKLFPYAKKILKFILSE